MRLEVKIQEKAKQNAKFSVVHFMDMQASGIMSLPASYLEEPEPKSGITSPIYVVNMLNMC